MEKNAVVGQPRELSEVPMPGPVLGVLRLCYIPKKFRNCNNDDPSTWLPCRLSPAH